MWPKIPRLRCSHKKFITMSSIFHLHMSVPHSHLLLRCFHQEQLLRSRCRSTNTALLRQEEEYFLLAMYHPPTGYEPNVIDNFDYSETTEIFLQEQPSDTMPSYLHDAELIDETIGKAIYSPPFTQEREEPASRRQAYHSFEESLLSASRRQAYRSFEESLLSGQSFFAHARTGRPVHELSSSKQKSSREMENERSGFSLIDKKSKFSMILPRFRNTNFKPILIGEVFRK